MIWLRRIGVVLAVFGLTGLLVAVGFLAWSIFIEIALMRGI